MANIIYPILNIIRCTSKYTFNPKQQLHIYTIYSYTTHIWIDSLLLMHNAYLTIDCTRVDWGCLFWSLSLYIPIYIRIWVHLLMVNKIYTMALIKGIAFNCSLYDMRFEKLTLSNGSRTMNFNESAYNTHTHIQKHIFYRNIQRLTIHLYIIV